MAGKLAGMLTFTAETHEYRYAGVVIPSVTQILGQAGMVEIPHFRDGRVERKRLIGTAVHRACEFLNQGDLDWSTVDPDVEPYARAYDEFLRRSEFGPVLTEHRFSTIIDGLSYAGTLDIAGDMGGVPFLIDIKTPLATQPHWAIQTAGYELGIKPPAVRPWKWQRAALKLRPDGEHRLVRFDDPSDRDVFRAALRDRNHPAVLRWKANHSIGIEEE